MRAGAGRGVLLGLRMGEEGTWGSGAGAAPHLCGERGAERAGRRRAAGDVGGAPVLPHLPAVCQVSGVRYQVSGVR